MQKTYSDTFTFNGKTLPYNRVPYNNRGERAIEIPIAIDFLNTQEEGPTLEVGNTLGYYRRSIRDNKKIMQREIVDKFEKGEGVATIDVLDLDSREKFKTILSISTVEHINQHLAINGQYGDITGKTDLEGPLKGITKIYDLLEIGGHALITMPFGLLTDGGWYVQASDEYLELLHMKYGIPKEAISLSYFVKTHGQLRLVNPRQTWEQVDSAILREVKYNTFVSVSRAIVVIQLTKLDTPFTLRLDQEQTPLKYYSSTIAKTFFMMLALIQKPIAHIVQAVETNSLFTS